MTVVTAIMISLTACYLIYNKKDYSDDRWEIWCINESKNSMLKVLVVVVPSEEFVSNAHKNSHAQFEFWLLYVCMYVCIVCSQVVMSKWVLVVMYVLTSSKWSFAHDIVCFGCCMQPSSYVQMSLGCCIQPSSYVQMSLRCCMQTKFLCPNEFGVLYATKFLCAKWVWGVVSPTSSLCAREITLVPWQLQHSIYFTFRNVWIFIYLFKNNFLKEQIFWWRKLRIFFRNFWIIIFDMEFFQIKSLLFWLVIFSAVDN
jgi:hypothetical protein